MNRQVKKSNTIFNWLIKLNQIELVFFWTSNVDWKNYKIENFLKDQIILIGH